MGNATFADMSPNVGDGVSEITNSGKFMPSSLIALSMLSFVLLTIVR
jgi:hypothetical protein